MQKSFKMERLTKNIALKLFIEYLRIN